MIFTADAVAMTLEWDRDELIDLLDDKLVQSDTNPDGILFDEGGIQITALDGSTRTFWRYSFVSELHWMALERYGFANEERPNKTQTEKLEITDRLAKSLIDLYGSDSRWVSAALARLMRNLGKNKAAEHYQQTSTYWAELELMREQALQFLAINKDDWDESECGRNALFMIEAGSAMFDVFPYSETLAVVDEAQKLAHRANHIKDEARALTLSGTILHAGGEFKLARDRAVQALKIYRSLGKKQRTSGTLHLLASIEHHEGNYAEARKLAMESLKINRKSDNRFGTGMSLRLLADIYYDEKKYQQAKTVMTQAFKIFRKIGDRLSEARSLTLLSQIAVIEKNYVEARQLSMEALQIKDELGDRNGVAVALHVLASIALAEDNYKDACLQTIQALRIDQELGNRHSIAASLKMLGEVALNIRQPREAIVLTSLAVLILREIGHADLQRFLAWLMLMVAMEHYEDQMDEINRLVTDAYRQDGGNELIESALERLRKIEM
jgi:tetratricopeptide (TPR) repeat protein